jgi:uncharacterized repeat protein (TIGR01451 family)
MRAYSETLEPAGAGRGVMSWCTRAVLLAVALSCVLVLPGIARSATEAATIDQCRNGAFGSAVQCIDSTWENGNLGETNSHYREDDSVPFRAIVTGLTNGTHTLVIQWDTLQQSTHHAYDYITSYNRTETNADPVHDLTGMTAGNCFPIPTDPTLSFPIAGAVQKPGCISIWNGTITGATYGTSDASGVRSITVTFTSTADTAVLAWGGHIASQEDWGLGNSASAISGSPYHMRLLMVDTFSLGNQDRSLKASAIPPAPTLTTQASSGTITLGSSVTDTATLSGPNGVPTGTIQFQTCGPNLAGAPTCDGTNSTNLGSAVQVGVDGTALSPSFTPSAPGWYCFRASYTPSATAMYSPTNHTDQTAECVNVVIAPHITIAKTPDEREILSGSTADFHIKVTNDGGYDLTNVAVTDALAPGCANSHGALLIGASYEYDCSLASVTSSFTNTAVVNGDSAGGHVMASDTAHVTVDHPAIKITKDTSTPTVVSGGTATFSIKVENTGDVTLTNVNVTDALAPNCANASVGTLAAGASTTYSCTLANVTSSLTNSATATGTTPLNGTVTSTDTADVAVIHPSIKITKDTSTPTITVGQTATFSIKVENTGDVTLTNVNVTDALAPNCANASVGTLAAGASTTYSCTLANVTSSFTNSATATGTPPVGSDVTSTDTAQVAVQAAQPTLTTVASADVALGGGPISDVATLSGGYQPKGTIVFKLWDNSQCTGTPAFTSADVAVDGNGPYVSGNYTPTAAGTYYWTADYTSSDANNANAAETCGSDHETVTVGPAAPSISTAASADVTLGDGKSLTDTATLAGGHDPQGSVVFKLYNTADCSNAAVFTSDPVTVNGDADYTSAPAYTPTAAGTYYWTASYTSSDNNNSNVAEGCGGQHESVVVSPAGPSLATAASADVTLGDGKTLTDTATLSGGHNPQGSIVFKLYSDSQCSTLVFTSDAVTVNGNGEYTSSPAQAPTAAGTYYWTASYTSSDNNNKDAAEGCGGENESVVVAPAGPSISTTASDSIVVDGVTAISDTATFTGGVDPQGTITFSLFDNNACAGDALFTSTVSVDGNGDYASDAEGDTAVPVDAGTYYWAAEYSGDANNRGVAEACNAAGESVVVQKASPGLVTHASAGVQVGGSVNDTASLTGGFHPQGSITFALFGNANCSGAPLFTSKVDAGGVGDYTSGSYTPTAGGTYYWTAHFTPSEADGNNNAADEPCGSANESVTVTTPPPPPPPPPTTTTPAPPPPPPVIDLQITKTDSPDPDLIGNTLRYRIVVTNNGPDTAHNVQMSDPLPVQVTFVSVSTTQGTCTGGQLVSCQLGTLAKGASATITILVKPRATGLVTNTATTVGTEAESNTANNTATTTTLVTAPFKPPVVNACYAVAVSPHSLTAGKKSMLVLRVKTNGKPAKGARVLVTGPGIHKTSGPTNGQGVTRMTVKPAKPGILRFQPVAHKGCSAPRIGVIGAFTPPVTG